MSAKPERAKHRLRLVWPARLALLTVVLVGGAIAAHNAGRAADLDTPPTPEEVARYLEWYKRRGSPRPSTAVDPVPEDVTRFLESYRHNGAPKPAPGAPTAAEKVPDNVARFLESYKQTGAPRPIAVPVPPPLPTPPTQVDATRFRESYRQSGPPTPRPAQAMKDTAPLPRVTTIDVQPVYDREVRQATAQEKPHVVPPPPPSTTPKEPTVEAPPPRLPASLLLETPVTYDETPRMTPFEIILYQVGCSSCGTGGGTLSQGGGASLPPAGGCSSCGSGNCVPGRLHGCSPCEANTAVGRFLCGVYQCLCCPDPCYDPKWIPLADSAFGTESARPQTQERFRWDSGRDLILPDRATYFWGRADGKGLGPNPGSHANPGGLLGESHINYNELTMYTEGALGNIGVFAEVPYRSLDGDLVGHAAGFGDVNLGTKTLLFDCELLQIAFVFRTYVPAGNATKGLGTGHVSLEPGMIVGLKLGPETYFQGQIAEWIPLGGDQGYEAPILNYHMSFNHVLCRILPDVPLVGTMEFNGWTFQGGEFTDPVLGGGQRATGGTYVSIGPGLRLFICDKIDFGIGTSFAVTSQHWADELFRSEFRLRF